MQQATIKTDTQSKQEALLRKLWIKSGAFRTVSFYDWNEKRINAIVMRWFR